MLHYVVVPIVLAVLVVSWVFIQRYIKQAEPEVRGPEDRAGGCCGACGNKSCDKGLETPVVARSRPEAPGAVTLE